MYFYLVVALPISQEGLTVTIFVLPTWRVFANSVSADPDLRIVRKWLETYQVPTPDAQSTQTVNSRAFAQLHVLLALREGIIVLQIESNQQRELFVIPAD